MWQNKLQRESKRGKMNKELRLRNRKKIDAYTQQRSAGKVDFYPAYIQIEQTNRCNAACIMCNHFYLGNRGGHDIEPFVMEKIEPVLPYCETIMLNGDGEPFLCSSIEHNIRKYGKYGVKVGANTNLCFVPQGLWSLFRDMFGFLNISCDGAKAETFEMIRCGLDWHVFLDNLKKLDHVAPFLKKNFDCVVSKQNIRELSGIVKLAGNHGIHAVRFRRLGVNPCIGNETDQVEYYEAVLRESMLSAQEVGQKLGVEVIFPAYSAFLHQKRLPTKGEMVDELTKRKEIAVNFMKNTSLANDYCSEIVMLQDWTENTWLANKACQWATERCYIDIRGNVTTCCYNMKKYMGSLKNQSFEEIWNGAGYIEFRKMLAKHILPGFCKNCNWIKEGKF